MLRPAVLLKCEGLALFAACLYAFSFTGQSWWLLAATVLLPDLSLLGYLRGKRAGAMAYNLIHSSVIPLGLAAALYGMGQKSWLWIPIVWLAHIGMDRMQGYGLKYETDFKDTHLQRL